MAQDRRAYYKAYNKERGKKPEEKLKCHKRYVRTMRRCKIDRMLRYKNDPEWCESVKAYNRERMRRIRAKEKAERIAQQQAKENEQK